ncbi:MAG: efflux RND transporter periplasmic adaptor subunit [Pseudomonadales bacterium]|jgi:RND family efflux transporter MFP subunit
MMSLLRRFGVPLSLALLGLAFVAALSLRASRSSDAEDRSTSESSADAAALTVSLVQPMPIVWPETVTANGAIGAWQEAVVGAEVGGMRLVEVLADVGDQVSKGQVLARFDIAPLQAAYAQQKAALAEAEARLVEAMANADRAKSLRQTQAISEQDLIKATTAAQAAQAQVEVARARLLTQKITLDNARVVAPDDGVISSRNAMLGAVSAPGMELFRLVRQNRLEWRAELTAAELAAINPGDRATVELAGGHVADGTVRQVAPVLDTGSRTGIVYVALDTENAGARAGMFAAGRIFLGERPGISIPASALVLRDGRQYVFKVDPEASRVVQVQVETGRRETDRVEVVSGLKATDKVVENGGAFLNDGDRVRVVPSLSTASTAEVGA